MNVGLVSLIFFVAVGCDWVGAEDKTYPPNKEVELTGVVKEGVGYDANNRREEYYYLSLEKAISVGRDEFSDEEKGVKEIQLVPLSDVVIGGFLGKQITIKGKLFHADNSHHHTKILLAVSKSNDARLVGKS
jgi:hypothetical protein